MIVIPFVVYWPWPFANSIGRQPSPSGLPEAAQLLRQFSIGRHAVSSGLYGFHLPFPLILRLQKTVAARHIPSQPPTSEAETDSASRGLPNTLKAPKIPTRMSASAIPTARRLVAINRSTSTSQKS